MNIQIFGTKKSFDTKKAQRYFKERRTKFQFIDLREKEMSKGELQSVMRAVGGLDALIDPKAKDQDTVALITYLAESQKFEKLLENQQILREPIVRNGKQATV
ncbi:arsenate reductase family protein, partial [Enorma massiliensis]|uniref:arsenate reductase family protein n=1 Tax=Enorma massiliensis TaxID=1472761 RepID=UPI003A8FE17B